MVKPNEVLWDYRPHTAAKHELLVRYLQAWFPIMASTKPAGLNVIDGFAGPGRYKSGEAGSPLRMIDAFVNHKNAKPEMAKVRVSFDFIEIDADRAAHLRRELAALTLPPNVFVEVHEGSFENVMAGILDAIPPNYVLAPTFAFIDPFGYTDHGLALSSRILQFEKCEVLIYLPLPYIARFVNNRRVEQAIDNVFGDDSWRSARGYVGREAERILHQCFLDRLRSVAGLAVAFEIDAAAERGWAGHTMYFGTSSPTGLDRMKEAMWKVDPAGGSRFAYVANPDQLTMFSPEPNLRELEDALWRRFGTRPFSIAQAIDFTIRETPFASRMHLKERTLAVAERDGRLEAWHPSKPKRKRRTFPPGTMMRFTNSA